MKSYWNTSKTSQNHRDVQFLHNLLITDAINGKFSIISDHMARFSTYYDIKWANMENKPIPVFHYTPFPLPFEN